MKLKKIQITVIILLVSSFCYSQERESSVINDSIVNSGHTELDRLRKTINSNPTIEINVKERRAALYRLWRLLWRQGMNMSSFDAIANDLLILSNDDNMVNGVMDKGFKTLEGIILNPAYIEEVRGH